MKWLIFKSLYTLISSGFVTGFTLQISQAICPSRGGGRGIPYKKDGGGGTHHPSRDLNSRFGTSQDVQPKSSWKKSMSGNMLFENWYVLGVKNMSSYSHKTGSLGFFSKFPPSMLTCWASVSPVTCIVWKFGKLVQQQKITITVLAKWFY